MNSGSEKISKFFDWLLEISWLLIIGLSPIFFTVRIYATWQLSEYFFFQVLTDLALLIWLLKMLFLRQANSFSYFKEFILKRIKFIWPAFLFILVLGLATLFSRAPVLSFFGSYFRRLGYITWLHFFIFFLLLLFNLKNFAQVKRILVAILLAATLTAIYGFLQILGLDLFLWQESATYTGRIFSTFGQPNFYGAWLVLVIPLVFYSLYLWQKKFLTKSLLWLLLIALFFNLFLTLSRSSWFGFSASFIFFLIAFVFLEKKRFLAFSLLIFIFLSIIFLIYLNLFSPLGFKGNPFLDRFISLTHLGVEGRLRLMTWQSGLDLIAKSPFLGYGPDNLQNQFISYYRPENAVYEAINSYPDRAHNEILDIALISGLLGLASYLFLLGYTFYLGFKNLRKNLRPISRLLHSPITQVSNSPITQLPSLYLLAALFGYFITNQLSFHIIPTLVYFWLYLGLICFLKQIGGQDLIPVPTNSPTKDTR